jgi:hypothetical protein
VSFQPSHQYQWHRAAVFDGFRFTLPIYGLSNLSIWLHLLMPLGIFLLSIALRPMLPIASALFWRLGYSEFWQPIVKT